MPGFVVRVFLACLLSGVAWVGPAHGNETQTLAIWVGGYEYLAEITPNTRLDGSLGDHANLVRDQHYQGHIPEDANSWVRVSNGEDGWTGMAFLHGQLHVLDGQATSDQVAVMSFSHDQMPTCGADHVHSEYSITTESMASAMMVEQVSANFDTLCADTVNGDCLMMELELAFDLEFQNAYPDDFQDRAVSILNMVEGFYQNQFGILFDVLSVEFLGNELFTTSTDANTLLSDVTGKLSSDEVPFVTNDSAIFHLISGRDFDGTVAGLAWVGTVCSSNGYASGVTNTLGSNSLTALVVAHEIGHNLGAQHDDPANNSCGGGYIMAPYVDGGASSFSSCSETYIKDTISGLSSVGQCFNFPADIGLTASLANAAEVNRNQSFQAHFDVNYDQAYAAADRFALSGSIPAEEGQLQSVSLDGQPCTVIADGTGYDCGEVASPTDGMQVSVQAVGSGTQFNLTQIVGLISDSGDVVDVAAGNDQLVTSFTVVSKAPTGLSITNEGADLRLDWQDHADDESGYRVERRAEGEGSYTTITSALAASAQTYLDTSVQANVVYAYRVSPVGGDWDGIPGNIASGAYYTEPAAPDALTVVAENGSARLSWQDRADNETHYLVERLRRGSDTWLEIASLAADSEAFVDTTAVPELTYHYRVFAANSLISESSNQATVVVPLGEEEGDAGGDDSAAQTHARAASESSGGGGAIGWGWWLLVLLAIRGRTFGRTV